MQTTSKDSEQIGKEGVSKLKEEVESFKNQLQGSQGKIGIARKIIWAQQLHLQKNRKMLMV